ncbi:MAG: hypothetical protein KIT79_10080 [Deltaproteobacteria bacterium]|nr:hypothetical protein [Deltaproteobacteria bacterium]
MSEIAPRWILAIGSLAAKGVGCPQAVPVRLVNWRRGFYARVSDHHATGLGAVPAPGASLNGVLLPIGVVGETIKDIDEREAVSDLSRRDLNSVDLHPYSGFQVPRLRPGETVAIYTPNNILRPAPEYPVLRSYIDVCFDAFKAFGSEKGVGGKLFAEDFLRTTDPESWKPIADDRARPLYPRYVLLDPETPNYVDELLRRLGLPGRRNPPD